MAKNRSTRRAFGRRALAFGIAMFAMVTLTAVGFASWLISSNAKGEISGNVKTETVTQASIKISVELVTENSKNNVQFAPIVNSTGLVQYLHVSDDDVMENLTLTFASSGNTVENIDKVGTLEFSIRVPDCIIAAAGLTKNGDVWSYDANKAYIALPSYAMDKNGNPIGKVENGALTGVTSKVTFNDPWDYLKSAAAGEKYENGTIWVEKAATTEWKFGGTMNFAWGARYLGMNPNYYYDIDERTSEDPTDEPRTRVANLVMLDLINLQKAVNGINDTDYLALCKEAELLSGAQTLADLEGAVDGASAVEGAAAKLAVLQTKLSAAIAALTADEKPTYTIYIEGRTRI